MAIQIDLRNSGTAEPTETPEYTKAADGLVQVIFQSKGCHSAWIEYQMDPAVENDKNHAVITPSDSDSSYTPFLLAGAKYKIYASVNPGGSFRATIIET